MKEIQKSTWTVILTINVITCSTIKFSILNSLNVEFSFTVVSLAINKDLQLQKAQIDENSEIENNFSFCVALYYCTTMLGFKST